MEKLERELAALRSRAETLHSRHTAAEAAFVDAEAKLQNHLLTADLDGDEKARTKLEAAVAACALTRDNFVKAIAAQQAKIAEAEAKIAAARAVIERNSAADKLARDLDEFEAALPDYLRAARRIANAADAVGHFHFESAELAAFTRNGQAQIEVAAAFALQELRVMVNAIRDGAAPIPPKKPAPASVAAPEPAPETRSLFCLRSIKWKNADGRLFNAMQYTDVELPLLLADKALRCGACVPITDERRKTLRDAHGGRHANPNAFDIVDLDNIEEHSGARYVGPGSNDPTLRAANFTPIDRSADARAIKISVPRL
jgi:hypothetical protein